MTSILAVYSSINKETSQSTNLIKHWLENLDATITERNLAEDNIPHLNEKTYSAFRGVESDLDGVKLSNQMVDEVLAADVIVVGAPMYNFGVSSLLKSWIDHIARPGVTFSYSSNGPEGLLKGKKAVVVTTRGGKHKGSVVDTIPTFMTTFFNFLGISDIEYVFAEGFSLSSCDVKSVLEEASDELAKIKL